MPKSVRGPRVSPARKPKRINNTESELDFPAHQHLSRQSMKRLLLLLCALCALCGSSQARSQTSYTFSSMTSASVTSVVLAVRSGPQSGFTCLRQCAADAVLQYGSVLPFARRAAHRSISASGWTWSHDDKRPWPSRLSRGGFRDAQTIARALALPAIAVTCLANGTWALLIRRNMALKRCMARWSVPSASLIPII